MAHVDRVRQLLELQGDHAVERALLDGDVYAYERHQTAAEGINSTFYVEIEPDLVAFHKPHAGIDGHSLDTPPICECAAWQLAKHLGDPYDRLVAVTVYRAVGPPEDDPESWSDGSLSLRHEGDAMKGDAMKHDVPEDALAAGFFDALIGNQDRHVGQFRFDKANGARGSSTMASASPLSEPSAARRTFRTSVGDRAHSSQSRSAECRPRSLKTPSCSGSPACWSPTAPTVCGGALSGCST